MFDGLVAQYLLALKAEGRTAKSLASHRESLGLFGAWLREEGHPPDPDRWTSSLVRSFIDHVQERTGRRGPRLSPTSVNTRLRSLRAFVNWLEREGLISRNPFARVKVPKAPRLVKPTVARTDFERLLAAARAGRQRHRDEAILLFVLDTGARAGQVLTLATID